MNHEFISGILIGALLILSVYNLTLFFSLGDRSYIHFILFLTGIVTYLASQSGFLAFHLFGDIPFINRYTSGFGSSLAQIGALSFTMQYLDTKTHWPFSKYFSFLAYLFVSLFFLTDIFFPGYAGYPSIIVPAYILFLVFWSLIISFNRNRERTIEYLIISTVFLVSFPFHLLQSTGIQSRMMLNVFSLESGLIAASIFLTITVSRRISDMRNSQLESQKEAIQNKERALESLKQLDQFKDRFLAATSHELRTPLQGIIGLSQIIRDKEGANLDPDTLENLDHIISSARFLNLLINDILDYSAMRAGSIRLKREPVDPELILRSLTRLNSLFASSSGVELSLEFSNEHKALFADPIRIEQIFQNLIHNAIKYNRRNGKVHIQTSSSADWVEITVQDEGAGIPEIYHELIFKEFYQIDEEIHNRAEGTGLGLAITRSLVELHNGTIQIVSSPDRGTSFIIRFPRYENEIIDQLFLPEESQHAKELVSGEIFHTNSEDTVNPDAPVAILVEDHPYTARIIQHILLEMGYRVLPFSMGKPALETILKQKPDLVILDIMLPDEDGFTILKEIRKKYNLQQLKVLVLTAMQKHEDMVRGMNDGANDFLNKPFQTIELKQRLQILNQWTDLENKLNEEQEHYNRDLELKIKGIYADLHDNLGARLTDMQMLLHRLEKDSGNSLPKINELQDSLNRTVQMLRNRLHDLEDQKMIAENFFDGTRFAALRRYTAAERSITFQVTEIAETRIMAVDLAFLRKELFSVLTEVLTNDIKYGTGSANFFADVQEDVLKIHFQSTTVFNPTENRRGNGSSFIQFRVQKLGGKIEMNKQDTTFTISLEIPL